MFKLFELLQQEKHAVTSLSQHYKIPHLREHGEQSLWHL